MTATNEIENYSIKDYEVISKKFDLFMKDACAS